MSKGVILEINGKYAIVLTKEGSFERTFSPKGAHIGEEITYEKTVRTARPSTKWVSAAACLVIGLGTWSYWNVSSQNQVYAYVGIDINPSLELGINQSGKVLTVQALNDDAKALLANVSVQGEPVDQAVASLAKAAAAKGFVHQDADIVITASPADNGSQATANPTVNQTETVANPNNQLSSLEQNLVVSAQKTLNSLSQNVHVDGLEVSSEFHSAAAKLGLPAAKYAFYLKANSDGHPVTIDQLKTTSISKLESDYGIPRDFLQGETIQSLDVALKNSDQLQQGNPNPSSTAPADKPSNGPANTPASTDGNSQNEGSTKPSAETQHPPGETNQQPGTTTSASKSADSGSADATAHANFFDILKRRLHLKPPAKNDQDTKAKPDQQTTVPSDSNRKDQSASKPDNQDNPNGDNAGNASGGTTKASGSDAGDKSKNKQSDSHPSSEQTFKQTVRGGHPVDLNVGVTVYENDKSPMIQGVFGDLLNK